MKSEKIEMSPEQLAELFHETYERLAPAFGWKTKKGCHCKFTELPQRNKALMIATCQTVLGVLQESVTNGSTTGKCPPYFGEWRGSC